MEMKLEDICNELRQGKRKVKNRSRQVKSGDIYVLFPAVQGSKARESALDRAVQNGAWCIIGPEKYLKKYPDLNCYITDDHHGIFEKLQIAAYKKDADYIPVVGITGTNGKTTSTYLLEHLYIAHHKKCGVMGTIEFRWPGVKIESFRTTPTCEGFHSNLYQMKQAGAEAAFVEISSFSLLENRVAGIPFSYVAFTNLTCDHLDVHKTMEKYFQAKRKLFTLVSKNIPKIINLDDPYGKRLLEEFPDAIAYSLKPIQGYKNFINANIINMSRYGMIIDFNAQIFGLKNNWRIETPLIGKHNVSNLLLVSAVGLAMGFSADDFQCFRDFHNPPGRLERIETSGEYSSCDIYVDYAHTPDGLYSVLTALRELRPARVLAVFGCGGDRDRSKRPLMGEAVAQLADLMILTSDNPRSEDPLAILEEIKAGVVSQGRVERTPEAYAKDPQNGFVALPDRREAIRYAVSLMQAGDVLLIAGKGHETYQIVGSKRLHFDDREEARAALQEMTTLRCSP